MEGTEYDCGIHVYVGKRAATSANGLGDDVFMDLSKMYVYQRRHLYIDNFSPIRLRIELERFTYANAIIHAIRAGLLLAVKQPTCLPCSGVPSVSLGIWGSRCVQ